MNCLMNPYSSLAYFDNLRLLNLNAENVPQVKNAQRKLLEASQGSRGLHEQSVGRFGILYQYSFRVKPPDVTPPGV